MKRLARDLAYLATQFDTLGSPARAARARRLESFAHKVAAGEVLGSPRDDAKMLRQQLAKLRAQHAALTRKART